MAYTDHTLVVLYGSLTEQSGQPNEIWQVGVRMRSIADHAAYIDAVHETIRIWWRDAPNMMSSQASLDGIKVADVTATGQDPADVYTYAAGNYGPNNPTWPSFCTAAITWETATPPAKGPRGRIFPPITVPFLGSTLTASNAQVVATAGVSLLDALTGGQTVAGATPVVASKKYGTLSDIIAVSADCIVDTQRRRRNQLSENRQTMPYPGP